MVMSLPVSQYEALLAEVRDLRRKAQRVQQLARPLLQGDPSAPPPPPPPGVFSRIPRPRSPPQISFPRPPPHENDGTCEPLDYTMESLLLGRQHGTASGSTNPCLEQHFAE
ncbi:uncharacterized protein LOC108913928 [Anoplophora glabripennis]|uniref:uncharacterized protein LOC108913928 n=1 Tax=Anoplophora glabripennis TaxID=217634 RepID=UPI0008751BB2|nr:uncharacterized protein LOC108913928 [Anoplophora glabripennis]